MFVIKKIIPSLCVFAILFSSPVTGLAADTETDYKQQSDFWTWIAGGNSLLNDLIGYTTGAVCPKSEDGYHHASSHVKSHEDGLYTCICDECGDRFVGYLSDVQQSYEDQVAGLVNTTVDSSGKSLRCYPSSFGNLTKVATLSDIKQVPGEWYSSQQTLSFPDPYTMLQTSINGYLRHEFINVYFQVPVSGNYYISWSANVYPEKEFSVYLWGGSTIYCNLDRSGSDFSSPGVSTQSHYFRADTIYGFQLSIYAPTLKEGYPFTHSASASLLPDDSTFSGTVIDASDITSRPTSITGDYGIVGDNGQITKVESTTIVNETNNTFTNPSTGTTSTITEWVYDYSDRSYNLTLDTGETVTVTYGDENITILEGDTVYNIYYIVNGTGEGTDPDLCQHIYTSTVDREATCTIPGQTTYTCSLCGHTYTEAIPAKGHTWTVLQTVTTEYDQEGNLLQQGYTIYQCSVCGEQYKDETGTGPPGSGDSSGEEGETIWDKLGNLIGSIFDGLLGIVEAVIGKVLDALIALVEMISEKLGQVVTLVLGFFDYIPGLFTGFLGFLSAVFPFLPEDIMTLLTFGIAVVVFIGIIKALRR